MVDAGDASLIFALQAGLNGPDGSNASPCTKPAPGSQVNGLAIGRSVRDGRSRADELPSRQDGGGRGNVRFPEASVGSCRSTTRPKAAYREWAELVFVLLQADLIRSSPMPPHARSASIQSAGFAGDDRAVWVTHSSAQIGSI